MVSAAASGAAEQAPPTPPPLDPDTPAGKKVTPLEPGIEEFIIPIPGGQSAVIRVPKGLEAEDWQMVKTMLDSYIQRMQAKAAKAKPDPIGGSN